MIFDIEGDGLNPTKIHVLSYTDGPHVKHTHDYDEMREILLSAKTLIGHNIMLFDIPVIERILGITLDKTKVIDTLFLSWYLNHSRIRHGLDEYGVSFGIPKPKITDWESLSLEEYAHRCDEDVKINKKLWQQLKSKLLNLYTDPKEAKRFIGYLMFKADCVREQEHSRWKLDIGRATSAYEEILKLQEEKLEELRQAMPPVPKYASKSRPSKPYKMDGTLSVAGAKWFALLRKHNLPEDYQGSVDTLVREEEPNPNSHQQIKDWLFSLGWTPNTFKFERNDDGTERKIPQVRRDDGGEKVLCPSVLKLAEKEPAIRVLEGLTVLQHRASIFKGFLRDHENGYLRASVGGLTNTLRFKHRVLVNLPGVNKPWGEDIRGSLVAREGKVLCGSDMVSLEDTTKRHFMWDFDPDYVTEMSRKGFDPHLDLAKHAGACSQEDIDEYKSIEYDLEASLDVALGKMEFFKKIKSLRKDYKTANYACIYGVGAAKLARETGLSKKAAQALIDAYWARNWSVRAAVEELEVRKVDGELWLKNPVSNFWYSLRSEKDKFSTLNQGTGVYCFDTWIRNFRSKRPQLTGQFHDEVILEINEGEENKCRKLLLWAIEETNKQLNLNIKLGVDIQFGKTYADIH